MLSLKFPLPPESLACPVRVLMAEVYEAVRDFRYGGEGFDRRRADVITWSLRSRAVGRHLGCTCKAAEEHPHTHKEVLTLKPQEVAVVPMDCLEPTDCF